MVYGITSSIEETTSQGNPESPWKTPSQSRFVTGSFSKLTSHLDPAHIRFATAPKGLRHHPYQAISNVETPVGTQTCSWYAGPGRQPAGADPPPDRPILIIVDYSPLQTLAHPRELDHASFMALRRHNFCCASTGELEALFTLFPPDEADAIQFTTQNTSSST